MTRQLCYELVMYTLSWIPGLGVKWEPKEMILYNKSFLSEKLNPVNIAFTQLVTPVAFGYLFDSVGYGYSFVQNETTDGLIDGVVDVYTGLKNTAVKILEPVMFEWMWPVARFFGSLVLMSTGVCPT